MNILFSMAILIYVSWRLKVCISGSEIHANDIAKSQGMDMFSFTGFCLFTEVTVPIYTASAGHQSFNTLHYFEKGIAYAVLEFPNFLPSLWTTKITAVYYHTQAVHINFNVNSP